MHTPIGEIQLPPASHAVTRQSFTFRLNRAKCRPRTCLWSSHFRRVCFTVESPGNGGQSPLRYNAERHVQIRSMNQRVSLFVTCLVDQLFPEVGLAMANVLERLGFETEFREEQTCCGQPAFNSRGRLTKGQLVF